MGRNDCLRNWFICIALGAVMPAVLGPLAACSDEGDGPSGTGGNPGGACELGTIRDCTCEDGEAGSQICQPDESGFAACYCVAGNGSTTGTTSAGGAEQGGSGQGGAGGIGGTDFGPQADLTHPSEGQIRTINTDIPFDGSATDVEDGIIADPVWASDLEGTLGTGANITAQLSMVGVHVITLTATDSDGNQDVDSINLILEP